MNKTINSPAISQTLKRFFSKFYDKNHVWLTKVQGKDMYSMGLGSEALKDIGTVRSIKFSDVDCIYTPGTTIATIEGSKTTREVETPITIYVEKINQKVKENKTKFVEAPENTWLIWGEIQDNEELDELLSVDQYSEYLDRINSSRRLKRGIPDHIVQERQP